MKKKTIEERTFRAGTPFDRDVLTKIMPIVGDVFVKADKVYDDGTASILVEVHFNNDAVGKLLTDKT